MAEVKESVFFLSCGACGFDKPIICANLDIQDKARVEHNKHNPRCKEKPLKLVLMGVVNLQQGTAFGVLPDPAFA